MSSRCFAVPYRWLGLSLLLALAIQVPLGPTAVAAAEPIDGLLAPPPSAAPAATPVPVVEEASPAIDPHLHTQLAEALRRARIEASAPGLSIAMRASDGREWLGTSGGYSSGTPLQHDYPLTIGSITKTFTAAMILGLVDEGRIGLDDPASRYLPNVKLVRGVTVRQLLGHRSGIADLYRPMKPWLSGAAGRALSSNDVLRPIGAAYFAPGADYAYSNTNYYLLGLILEAVAGRSFNAELEARFGSALGLEHTRLLGPGDTALPPAWSTAFWTSGAMVSTPMELATWGQALYGGNALSDASRKRMLDFSAGSGYGVGTQQLTLGNRTVPGHSGLLYSNTSLLVHLPAEGMTVALISTMPHTNLEAALLNRYGGPSLLELLARIAA